MYSKIDVEKRHYCLENNLGDIKQSRKHMPQYLTKPSIYVSAKIIRMYWITHSISSS